MYMGLKMNDKKCCRYCSWFVEETDKIIIVTPYYQNGTLYDVLHERKLKLNTDQKIDLLLGILNGLKYLNDNKIPTKMIFIHIPKMKNLSNIEDLAHYLDDFF